MYFLAILISLAVLISAERFITITSTAAAPNKEYFKGLKLSYDLKKVGDTYVSTVLQAWLDGKDPSFKIFSHSLLSSGGLVDSPAFDKEKTSYGFSLNVRFRTDQLTEAYGCTAGREGESQITVCKLRLIYSSIDGMTDFAIVDYSIRIIISVSTSGSYELGIGPIKVNGCDCELIINAECKTQIFTDKECTKPLKAGDEVLYGDTICLKLWSDNNLVGDSYFRTTMLNMYYRGADNRLNEMDIMSVSKLSCGSPCQRATAYAVFDLPVVGQVQFYQVVLLEKSLRRLVNDDGMPVDNEETAMEAKGVRQAYDSFTVVDSAGIKTGVALLITVFAVILMIL